MTISPELNAFYDRVDEQLGLTRTRDARQAAAMVAFEGFRREVFALCMKLLKNKEDAADVTQWTCLRLFREMAIEDIDHHNIRNLKSWLLTTARNHCKDLLGRRKFVSGDVDALQESNQPRLAPEVDETTLDSRARNACLAKALNQLREQFPNQHKAFMLCRMEELSHADAARQIGCAVGTISSHINRAEKYLRAAVMKQESEKMKKAGAHVPAN